MSKNKKTVNNVKIFGLDLQQYDQEKKPSFYSKERQETVTIPLKGGFGSSLSPDVEVRDEVEAGEIIARDDKSISTPALASLAGEVIEVVELASRHEETGEVLGSKIQGVKIKASPEQDVKGEGVDWEKEKPKNLRELFYLAGLTSFGQTGVPTEFNSSYSRPEEVKHVIVNGVKTEPFVRHLINYEEEFPSYKTGLQILARAFPNSPIHLVLDEGTMEKLDTISSSQRIKVHSAETESYMSKSKMLAREILGVESLDEGGYLLDKGVLALPEIFPLAAYRAVVEGVPYIRGRFSLSGPAAKDAVIETPIGTPVKKAIGEYIDEGKDAITIEGGPLSGSELEDLESPVGRDMSSLVQLTKPQGSQLLAWLQPGIRKNSYTNAFFSALAPGGKKEANSGLHGEERPCVYCGWCSDVCPVDILPYQILKTYNHDMVDEVNRLQPQRCVDCGLCSYVCPSKLPLSDAVKQAKKGQQGDHNNYVKYEEDEEGRITVMTEKEEIGRGEESE
ncbi:MAG: 4Fe-4S dicluster domain-containing protein [Candidatus Bipolaricaulia bacterium]